jgi:Flp pilus assembly pilin Flp
MAIICRESNVSHSGGSETEKEGAEKAMELFIKVYVNARERALASIHKYTGGQTMTEYALILGAVAIVAYTTYKLMGQDITSMVIKVDSSLASS